VEDFVFDWFASFEVPDDFTTTKQAHSQVVNALKTGPISADQVAAVLLKALRELEHRILMAETRLDG